MITLHGKYYGHLISNKEDEIRLHVFMGTFPNAIIYATLPYLIDAEQSSYAERPFLALLTL